MSTPCHGGSATNNRKFTVKYLNVKSVYFYVICFLVGTITYLVLLCVTTQTPKLNTLEKMFSKLKCHEQLLDICLFWLKVKVNILLFFSVCSKRFLKHIFYFYFSNFNMYV